MSMELLVINNCEVGSLLDSVLLIPYLMAKSFVDEQSITSITILGFLYFRRPVYFLRKLVDYPYMHKKGATDSCSPFFVRRFTI